MPSISTRSISAAAFRSWARELSWARVLVRNWARVGGLRRASRKVPVKMREKSKVVVSQL